MCIIVQQNRFQASLQSQEVSWFGSTRTWVYLSYTNRSRVVLYLRPRSASVRENHRPRGKATGGRKAPLFGVSCWWENYWWFAFLCVGIVVPCLSNGLTDFFDLLFCFFIYERSPEISTIYLISLMKIVQCNFDGKITGIFLRIFRICYYEGPIECTIKDVSLIHIKLKQPCI